MRVIISIGGSVLVPDLDTRHVEGHASVVETPARDGCGIGVVVGGGGVTYSYIGAVCDLGANEAQLDRIDIDITRVNARLFTTAFGS